MCWFVCVLSCFRLFRSLSQDEPVPVPSSTAAAPSTAAAAPLPNNDAPESAAEEEDLTWGTFG